MCRPSRRNIVAGAGAVIGSAMLPMAAETETGPSTLAAAAKTAGLTFGTAAGPEMFKDAAYRALIAKQASIFAPQDSLKFGALQPELNKFDFSTGDALVDAARAHGLQVRGHTLFWNDWLPSWIKGLSRREVGRVFDEYIDTVVPHFAGRLQSWDVVNEPFYLGRDKPGTFRPGPWYEALGPAYIFESFRRTAALDPDAKLVLNEAWTEREDPAGLAVRRSLLRLIDRMQDKGVKLDAIGLQGHLTPSIPYDDAAFADFLHEIGRRKLDIYITEFDIDDQSYSGEVGIRDRRVADRASAFLKASLAVPAVKMVVTWGLSDRYSWWRSPEIMAAYGIDHLPRPLPYDDMLAPKQMWTAMEDAFRKRPSSARG